MFKNNSTAELIKDLLFLMQDGGFNSPDFQPLLQECKKRLNIK